MGMGTGTGQARTRRASIPPRIPGQRGAVPRILILFSDVGEGHASAARTLAADIRAEKPESDVILANGFDVLGRFLCWFMRDFYRWQHFHFPALYKFSYGLFRRVGFLRTLGALFMSLLGSGAELNLVLEHAPDLIISTDARLNAVLGQLRRTGKLKVPVCAVLTDLAGLEFWAHKGVDLHLVMDPSCVGPVERIAGLGSARLVRPLVAPAFFRPLSRTTARERLGLSRSGRVVLVSGGGWGFGDMMGAIRAALTLSDTTVVCVTGRNSVAQSELQEMFSDCSRVIVLGFTCQMNELMAASDVVVHATAGVTYLEAVARNRPVVAYKAPFGHPAIIAAALAKQGRQQKVDQEADLPAALLHAFDRGQPTSAVSPPLSAATTVLMAGQRVRPLSRRRVWVRRLAAATILVALLGGVSFFSDDSYPVLARALKLPSASFVSSSSRSVGLVIQANPDVLSPALVELARYGDRASFAYHGGWSSDAMRALQQSGNGVLSTLGSGSFVGWVHTRRALAEQAAALGVSRPTVYLPPREGFTLGQYVLAREKGALPLGRTVVLDSTRSLTGLVVKKGGVLVVVLNSNSSNSVEFLDLVLRTLQEKGLVGIPPY